MSSRKPSNRPWHIKTNGDTLIYTYAYDTTGRRDTLDYPNGTTTDWDFDDLDRMTAVTHRATNGAPFATFSYPGHDQVGNISDVTGDRNATYFYDDIYRLLSVVAGSPETFTYDDAGNRKTGPGANDKGALATDTSYLHNDANQLKRGRKLEFNYDNLGNQIERVVLNASGKSWLQHWDSANRLVTVEKIKGAESKAVNFKYDPFGRRIKKELSTVVNGVNKTSRWKYVYDNNDIAVEIYTDPATNVTQTVYTHGPGIDEHLALERNGQVYYYHADGLGSIAKITDADLNVVQSYSYDSFGMVKSANNTFRNSFTYTGREWDKEAGLYYYRARYYDPMEGRFISKDPIAILGNIYNDYPNISEDQYLRSIVNLYGYTGNNPVNWRDPLGLWTVYGGASIRALLPGVGGEAGVVGIHDFSTSNESISGYAEGFVAGGLSIGRGLFGGIWTGNAAEMDKAIEIGIDTPFGSVSILFDSELNLGLTLGGPSLGAGAFAKVDPLHYKKSRELYNNGCH